MKKLISLFLAIVASVSVAIAETTIIYKEPFSSSQGDFAVVYKNLPAGLSYVWKWRNATYGMVASAYVSGTAYAAESWLISPSISLQNYTSASLSFDHAVNKGTPTNLKVKISTNEGSTWSDLTISQWPEGTSWDFINAAVSLDAYVGNSIKIAFVYISTASICPSWEIKNFQISGENIIITNQDTIVPPPSPTEEPDSLIARWITVKELAEIVGVDTILDGTSYGGGYRYVLKDNKKQYTFNKIRIDFTSPPNYYNFIGINHYNTDGPALRFSQGDIRVYINGSSNYITHTEFKKKGTFISGNLYEFDLNTILGTTDIKCYVNYYQFHFLSENCSIYVTSNQSEPEGTINGVFSISKNKKIRFSPGNLQYQASTGTWRFAEHQWDFVGNSTQGTVYENTIKCNNELISNTYTGWIDLFGRGTGDNPTLHSMSPEDYNTIHDWGENLSVSGNVWRTLTANEWNYLTRGRARASELLGSATVNNVHGYILLPDNWEAPTGVQFNPGSNGWNNNVYSVEQMAMIEETGAVFLPATGYRNGLSCYEVQTNGHYWSIEDSHWWYNYTAQYMQTYDVYSGRAIRLVQDEEILYTITWNNYDGNELEKDENVPIGSTPLYNGPTPVKNASKQYIYTFKGWNPEIETVTGDAIYTAVFDSTAVINGGFSVSTDRKVYFSPGNLQYQASTDMWRFAEHQWDYIGDANLGTVYEDGVKCNNALLSSTYSGWIDLFGYSTATTYYGVSTSKNNSTYAGEFVDWGHVFQSQWRTLTRNEWEYLLNKRPNHASLFAFVRVEGVKGLLLLPDNFIGDYNITTDYNYSSSEFASLEALGAIFLPANGYRDGTGPKTVQTEGEYYANTSHLNNLVDGMQFSYNSRRVCADANNNRYDGRGVRLVKDIDQNANDSTQISTDSIEMVPYLNMIYINGDSVEGYDPYKYTYTFTYPIGTKESGLPSSTDITWDLGDEYQMVTATQAGNTIVLTVISGRGLVTTYVLSFVIERPNQYTVTTLSNNDAWGIAIGGNVYNANSNVSIGAFANDGYQFYHWNNTITANPYTFQLTQDTSFVATFLPNTEEEIITDVTSNSVHMEWEVKPWGNHGYWVWVYIDKDHKQWYCKMRFYADGTLSKFYWGPASKHYDASNPPLEIPVFRAPQRYFDATTISYDLSDIEEDLQHFYTIEGADEYENVVSVLAGTFKTPAHTSNLDNIDSSSLQGGDRGRLIFRNGHIFILRGEKVYSITGQEVK